MFSRIIQQYAFSIDKSKNAEKHPIDECFDCCLDEIQGRVNEGGKMQKQQSNSLHQ